MMTAVLRLGFASKYKVSVKKTIPARAMLIRIVSKHKIRYNANTNNCIWSNRAELIKSKFTTVIFLYS